MGELLRWKWNDLLQIAWPRSSLTSQLNALLTDHIFETSGSSFLWFSTIARFYSQKVDSHLVLKLLNDSYSLQATCLFCPVHIFNEKKLNNILQIIYSQWNFACVKNAYCVIRALFLNKYMLEIESILFLRNVSLVIM